MGDTCERTIHDERLVKGVHPDGRLLDSYDRARIFKENPPRKCGKPATYVQNFLASKNELEDVEYEYKYCDEHAKELLEDLVDALELKRIDGKEEPVNERWPCENVWGADSCGCCRPSAQ